MGFKGNDWQKWLIALLYKPIAKVKGITQEQLDAVISATPEAGEVYSAVNDFKEILKSKVPEKLSPWIVKAKELKIPEIDAFISGICMDFDAVKNAILMDYNNGLAEGSVNKLKLIKRVMYGRCSFSMLKNKALKLEYIL